MNIQWSSQLEDHSSSGLDGIFSVIRRVSRKHFALEDHHYVINTSILFT